MSKATEINTRHKKALWNSHLLYYKEPLVLDRGEGLYVYDEDDNKYLDFFGGILTTSVSHNHPKIINKIKEQLDKIIHTSTLYPHRTLVELAEKIAAIAPGNLEKSYFTTTGSEANDLAVSTARMHTGNFDMVILRHSYHGGTSTGKAMTSQFNWRFDHSATIPGYKQTLNGYCYRCPFNLKPDTCDTACAQDLENVIKTSTSGRIAGIIFEPIQGVGGFITPPPNFLKIVSEITRQYGGVVIADEVQGGFGRTGKHQFSVSHWEVEPDIMTMAKGIANGLPLGGVIATDKVAKSMDGGPLMFNTYGGNPISSVAALATIQVLEEEAGTEHCHRMGELLMGGLKKMSEKYAKIGDVRGKGLMVGVELVKDRTSKEPDVESTAQFFEATKKAGLLIGKGGIYGNVIRIAPPLAVNEEQINEALEKFDRAFAAIH
ncbi:MAG: aspartate aminotransferase family protein [Gammaproteobacteria bacterium]|nr:aspartate aminotransferase family protein [Gammaproteobacteria bacterium]